MDKLVRESGFHGVLEEYPQVAVDYFAGNSLNCKVFFLSHCHTDHMVGLNRNCFKEKLESNPDIKLYTSKCTMEILTADYNYMYLKHHMIAYDVHETATIAIPGSENDERKSFLVTLLPAGHCPGSVMFLFEGFGGTVLHTGDFRLTVDDLMKMESLHSNIKVKRIDKLYIDTTFCCSKVMCLPRRTQSRDLLFELLDPWLSDRLGQIVFLELPANFGCEYLFVELSNRYKMKVHVPSKKLWRYKAIPDIMEAITIDGTATRIHACNSEAIQYRGGEKCDWKYRSNYIRVRCSTMWFMFNTDLESAKTDDFIVKENDHRYRLCYSMHSSLKEILEFVQYLKPKAVYPLVVPKDSTLDDVMTILSPSSESLEEASQNLDCDGFGVLNNKRLKSSCGSSADHDLSLDPHSLPATPPAKKIRLSNGNLGSSAPRTPPPVKEPLDSDTPEWSFVISPYGEPASSQEDNGSVSTPRRFVTGTNDSQKSDSSFAADDEENSESQPANERHRSNLYRDKFGHELSESLPRENHDSNKANSGSNFESTDVGPLCHSPDETMPRSDALSAGDCRLDAPKLVGPGSNRERTYRKSNLDEQCTANEKDDDKELSVNGSGDVATIGNIGLIVKNESSDINSAFDCDKPLTMKKIEKALNKSESTTFCSSSGDVATIGNLDFIVKNESSVKKSAFDCDKPLTMKKIEKELSKSESTTFCDSFSAGNRELKANSVIVDNRQVAREPLVISKLEGEDICIVEETTQKLVNPLSVSSGFTKSSSNEVAVIQIRSGLKSRNGVANLACSGVKKELVTDSTVITKLCTLSKDTKSDVPVIDLTEDDADVPGYSSGTDDDWGSTPELDFS